MGYYGSFYDTSNQGPFTINVAYPVTINSTDSTATNGVYIGSPTSRIYNSYTGVYNIQFSAQFGTSSVGNGVDLVNIWIKKNGINVPDTDGQVSIPEKTGGTISAWNYLLALNAGDYIEFYVKCISSSNVSLTTLPGSGVAPNDNPLSPSIIVTYMQAAYNGPTGPTGIKGPTGAGAGSQTLSQVLTTGNSAGTTGINMNSQNITSVNNLTVSAPYNFSIISIFSNSTARDASLPSPYTGQFVFLTGTNKLQYYNSGWFNINSTLNSFTISGFTLGVNYEVIYVNSSNVVIAGAVSDGYTIVRFYPTTTTSGSITLTNTTAITYLLCGGGGGGGGATSSVSNGGGGGGGGYVSSIDNMSGAISYAVTVGGGGAGGTTSFGTAGSNSSLAVLSGTITANGGGRGGGGSTVANLNGGNGGCGGGAGASNVVGTFTGGTGNQGQNGGVPFNSGNFYSGGGGGATAAGSSTVGTGGNGTVNTITGASVTYAGGGGGGSNASSGSVSPGGSGGGGNGGAGIPASTYTPATAGTDGLGGGGGGGGQGSSANIGFKGGAGVVIVRFASYS